MSWKHTGLRAKLVTQEGKYVGKNMKWTPKNVENLNTHDKMLRVMAGGHEYEIGENDQGQLVIWSRDAGTLWARNNCGNVLLVENQPLFTKAHYTPLKDEKETADV
jgi:hypothetical protein